MQYILEEVINVFHEDLAYCCKTVRGQALFCLYELCALSNIIQSFDMNHWTNLKRQCTQATWFLAKPAIERYTAMFHNCVCRSACTVKPNQSKSSHYSDTKVL